MAAGDVIVIREDGGSRKGVYFDGTDDYILIDAHAVERVAANDTVGTYSAWIYYNGGVAYPVFLSAGDNDSANEYLRFFIYGAANATTVGISASLKQGGAMQWDCNQITPSIPLRTWAHVALVQNGTVPLLYVNGEAVDITFSTSTDTTMWYDELANCDKFALGVLESNNTHTQDFNGAIGQVKYWATNLTAQEIKAYYDYEAGHISSSQLTTALGSTRQTALNAALRLNVTMENDGTTDSGLGADNGTLTGDAHWGGDISTWSRALEAHLSGHAAEMLNTFKDGNKYVTVIKKGD